MASVHPVILSGGSGTRLWPLSRRSYPKQFLNLVGQGSLMQQTCLRLADPLFGPPSVVGNHEHRFIIAEQLKQIDVAPAAIVLEPVGRNTAPAAAIAALMAAGEDAQRLILLLPSDHVVASREGFTASIQKGIEAAQQGDIVTFGVHPEAPETGYGYIEAPGQGDGARKVLGFAEKPSREKAQGYLGKGGFFWNAGIFLFTAQTMIAAFEQHAPDILAACRLALDNAERDLDFLRLDRPAYAACKTDSLDYAIMEKTGNISCVPLATQWNDLGAWPSVWRHMDKDADGNVTRGDVILHGTSNSFAHSADGACLALVGLDNVMAVVTKDAILVAAKDRAEDVKKIVGRLNAEKRGEARNHTRIYRPWGWYEGLDQGRRFQVKCLMVKPGAQLSLQSHFHRAEHWVVVSGTAEVTLGEKTFLLSENESTYIPIGTQHRLANPGKVPALLIEVQSGAYLGEDDIVRFEDDYGRKE